MGTVRQGAYSGGSHLAVPFPGEADREPAAVQAPRAPESEESAPVEDEPASPAAKTTRSPSAKAAPPAAGRGQAPELRPPTVHGAVVSDGSGLILGLLVWGWVIVPYLKGGTAGVKAVLSAKFFNKKNGEPLP